MVKNFGKILLKRGEVYRTFKVVVLLLLMFSQANAEDMSPQEVLARTCEKKATAPKEKQIIKGIEGLLSDLDLLFTEGGRVEESRLGREYIERTRLATLAPVDHMHGRCWNNDQLSCSMLLSSLHEMSSFLRSLQRAGAEVSFARAVIKVEEQALTLTQFCKAQPWKLS